jgi:hypothetical protein
MMGTIGRAARNDRESDHLIGPHMSKCIKLHVSVCYDVTTGKNSPIGPSLTKLGLEHDRWLAILRWPFHGTYDEIVALAAESKAMYSTLVYTTGAVPSEHFSMQKRPDYIRYQARTNRFFPGPQRQVD